MSFQNALINAAANLNWLGNFGNLGTPQIPLQFGGAVPFQNGAGSGVGQMNNMSGNSVSITSGTPLVLDLNTLTNPDGSACAFTDLLFVAFWNYSTTAGQNLVIGGGSNPIISIWGSGNLTVIGNTQGTAVASFATSAATGWAINLSTATTLRLEASSGTLTAGYVIAGH